MAIEVRIPTILRTYTGGEKAVTGDGAVLSALIDDLEANHPGLKERLIEDGDLRRFVNVYVNDEDVRFIGGLEPELSDGDHVVVLPAVAGRAPGAGTALPSQPVAARFPRGDRRVSGWTRPEPAVAPSSSSTGRTSTPPWGPRS